MPNYGVAPVVPEKKDPPAGMPGVLVQNWFEEIIKSFPGSGTGWNTLLNAMDAGAVFIFDENGNSEPVTDKRWFSNNFEKGMSVVQASLEGRLCIRQKDTNKLIQIRTSNLKEFTRDENAPLAEISFSKPINRLPTHTDPSLSSESEPDPVHEFQGEAVEHAEPPLMEAAAPEKPSLWERIAAIFSGSYKEKVERYDSYIREQRAQTSARKTVLDGVGGNDEREMTLEELDRDLLKEKLKSDPDLKTARANEVIREKMDELGLTLHQNSDINKRKPLDPKAPSVNKPQEVRYVEDLYYNGMDRRLSLAENASLGQIEEMDMEMKRSFLGEALLGEWLRRTVKDLNEKKIPFEKNPLYKAVREDPTFLDRMKKDLLSSREAKEVLNGKSSTMLNAMGGPYHFTVMVDFAVKHADKLNQQRQRGGDTTKPKEKVRSNDKQQELLIK